MTSMLGQLKATFRSAPQHDDEPGVRRRGATKEDGRNEK